MELQRRPPGIVFRLKWLGLVPRAVRLVHAVLERAIACAFHYWLCHVAAWPRGFAKTPIQAIELSVGHLWKDTAGC